MRKRNFIWLSLVLALGAFAEINSVGQTRDAQAATRTIKIYLPHENAATKNNPLGMSPVTRRVAAAAPLRPAIESVLAGATDVEQRRGFYNPGIEGLEITRLEIIRGTAFLSFKHRAGTGWSGDLSPFYFKEAVTRTARQFPTVKRVVMCVDNDLDFGDESDRPHRSCR